MRPRDGHQGQGKVILPNGLLALRLSGALG